MTSEWRRGCLKDGLRDESVSYDLVTIDIEEKKKCRSKSHHTVHYMHIRDATNVLEEKI
jgi:hypothetical protein